MNYVFVFLFQPSDSWVTVHKLKSLADGGILDLDDRLFDVVDDKDQVPIHHHQHLFLVLTTICNLLFSF